MQYFELYNLPVSFAPDKQMVSKRYFELQKKYHPDFFANARDDEKEEALEMSALANKAFKTFQSQNATIRYVLQLKGLLQDEEKYNLPPAFLMEVMELNELKMDGADDAAVQERAISLERDIYKEVEPIIKSYQDEVTSEMELLKVKDYYYKQKYLARIKESS